MKRGTVLVAVATVLALTAALFWPPCVPSNRRWNFATSREVFTWRDYVTWDSRAWPDELHLRWVGALDAAWRPAPRLTAFSSQRANGLAFYAPASVHLPTLLAEIAFVLLLGGGALTWAVRRERRRKAVAPE